MFFNSSGNCASAHKKSHRVHCGGGGGQQRLLAASVAKAATSE